LLLLLALLGVVTGSERLLAQASAQIGFTTNAVVLSEDAGTLVVQIRRDRDLSVTNTVRVNASLGGGTQQPLSFESRSITFLPGTNLVELVLEVTPNEAAGVNRSLTLILNASIPGRPFSIVNSQLLLTVLDDDGMVLQLGTNRLVFLEGAGDGGVKVLRGGNDRVPVSVDLVVGNPVNPPPSGPRLIRASTNRVEFGVGETQRLVQLTFPYHPAVTTSNQATVTLVNPSTSLASVGAPSAATLVVLDADGVLAMNRVTWAEPGATSAVVRVQRVQGAAGPSATGFLSLEEGTARAGEDYSGGRLPIVLGGADLQVHVELSLLDNPARVHGRWLKAVLQNVEPLRLESPVCWVWIPPSGSAAVPRFRVDGGAVPIGLPTNAPALAAGPGGTWFVGGAFGPVGGASVSNMVRLTRTFAVDPGWTPGGSPAGRVTHAASLPDGRTLVGGDFLSWGGVGRSRLAVLEAGGSLDETTVFEGVTNVIDMAPDALGRVYVRGQFGSLGGIPFPGLARFGPDGRLDETFRPAFTGSVSVASVRMTGGMALGMADASVVFLGDSGTLDTVVPRDRQLGLPAFMTALADGSVRIHPQEQVLTVGGAVDGSRGTSLRGAVRTWSVGSGAIYAAFVEGPFWKLTRHWGDGSPDGRMETWFDGPVSAVAEAPDGTVLVSGSFQRVDGWSRNGLVQLLAPEPLAGIRWHAGSAGFAAGERWPQVRIPAWRESNLEVPMEVEVEVPASPAIVGGVPFTAPLRFEAGARVGWVSVPVLDRGEAGEDAECVLVLPESVGMPGASRVVGLTVFRDEQEYGFDAAQVEVAEFHDPPMTAAEALRMPHLTVRRFHGAGYAGSVVVRFVGGTVKALTGQPYVFPSYPVGKDFLVVKEEVLLSFSPGVADAPVVVGPLDDGLSQGDREALFRLEGAVRAGLGEARLVVRDNDLRRPSEVLSFSQGYAPARGGFRLLRHPGFLDGRQYVPGRVTGPDGAVVTGPLALPSSSLVAYVGPGPNGTHYVLDLGTPGFSSSSQYLMRFLSNGEVDPAWARVSYRGLGLTMSVSSAMWDDGSFAVLTPLQRGEIYGSFQRPQLIELRAGSGQVIPSYQGYVGSSITAQGIAAPLMVPEPGGGLLLAGQWLLATNGVGRAVVRLDAAGATDPLYRVQLSQDGGGSSSILQARLDGKGRLLLAGSFERVDGVGRIGFARLLPTGRVDMGFAPGLPQDVRGWKVEGIVPLLQGGVFVVVGDGIRSKGLLLREDGSMDATRPVIAFDRRVYGAGGLPDGSLVVWGDFHFLNGQERHGSAWLTSGLELLGDAPLGVRLDEVREASVRLTVDARAAGFVEVEQGQLDGRWERIGGAMVGVGTNQLELPVPPGPMWFLRAVRRD
jgi:hypothetical protein